MNQIVALHLEAPETEADPILPLHREWAAARAEWYALADLPGNGNWDHPDSVASEQREYAAVEAMLATRPTSLAGFAALADVLWCLEGPGIGPGDPDFPEQADWTSNRLIRHIWESASGQTGFPPSAVRYVPRPELEDDPSINRK